MGVVYKARHVRLRRTVALKMILAGEHAGAAAAARFLAEAEVVARLQHPNVVQIFHFDEHDGHPYFELEYAEGGSLDRRLDGTPWPARRAAGLVETLAGAVAAAHRLGIIHRDLKPGNILLTADGTPKLSDFGLAKSLNTGSGLTATESILGSPSYMAPEQAEGKARRVGPAADIYALGAILYELMTGRPPFRGATVLDTLQQVKTAEPVSPGRLVPGLPRDIETIALKCLQKDPGKRYESAAALAEDLRRFQAGEPILARPVGSLERGWRWSRRNPVVAGSLGAAAAALMTVAILATIFAMTQAEARRRADLSLAISEYERGQALCEKDEIGPGMLRLISSWRSAVRAGDAAWQHAARANLAVWQSQYPRLLRILPHAGRVDSVAFSPDGKIILTGGGDFAAKMWDARTGKPVGEPLKHRGFVWAVAFSSDGKTILTGSDDRTAQLWDARTGKAVGEPLQHGGGVWAVAFSPDGRTALTGSFDGTARLWDAADGHLVGEPMRHGGPVLSVAFSPDGETVLTGSDDRTARLWDARTGDPIGLPMVHDDRVRSVAFNPVNETILTGCEDGTARFWDAASHQPIEPPLTQQKGVVVKFSPDGKTVLTGSQDGTARLWSAETHRAIGDPLTHQAVAWVLAFSPDGRTVLTGCEDGRCGSGTPPTAGPWGTCCRHQSGVWAAAFSPDGKTVLAVGMDGTARLWSTPTGKSGEITVELAQRNLAMAFSSDAQFVMIGSEGDNKVTVWDIAGARPRGRPMPHDSPVTGVAFSRDGQTLVTACEDGTGWLWDAAGNLKCKLLGHGNRIFAVAFSPDGETVLTGSDDKSARLWNARTGEPIGPPMQHPAAVQAVAFSTDGEKFLTGCDDKTARLWDFATREPIGPPLPHDTGVCAVAFSPDRSRLFTGGYVRAWLWDVSAARHVGPAMRHRSAVEAVAFSPGGKAILTGAWDSNAWLWDAETAQPLGPPLRHPEVVMATAFSRDGKTMLTGTSAGTVRIWSTADLADDVERVATWVESLTALTVDAAGSIQALDRDAWTERRGRVERQGGPPLTGPVR